MEKCLICEKKKTFSTLICKMCGMGVENMHKSLGFFFCSRKCANSFSGLYNKSSDAERKELLKDDVII